MLVDTHPPWFGGRWLQAVPGQSVTAGGAHPWCRALCGGADHGAGTGTLPLGRGGGVLAQKHPSLDLQPEFHPAAFTPTCRFPAAGSAAAVQPSTRNGWFRCSPEQRYTLFHETPGNFSHLVK